MNTIILFMIFKEYKIKIHVPIRKLLFCIIEEDIIFDIWGLTHKDYNKIFALLESKINILKFNLNMLEFMKKKRISRYFEKKFK